MIKLYSAETFRDYVDDPGGGPSFIGNGNIVLLPTLCEVTAEVDTAAWQLNLTHPYDEEKRYEYLEKGAVIAVDALICREQESPTLYFRIRTVRMKDSGVEVVAYPVAMDSINEVPIGKHEFSNLNLQGMLEEIGVNVKTGPNQTELPSKYVVDNTNFGDAIATYVYAENTNLQEFLNGDQDGSLRSLYGFEMIYDRYTYKLYTALGSGYEYAKLYPVRFRFNLKGFDISEDTSEVITRIYPMSADGYTRKKVEEMEGDIDIIPTEGGSEVIGEVGDDETEEFTVYVDADEDTMTAYPMVYARAIQYDDVKMIDERSDDDYTPTTQGQNDTRNIKEAIVAKVQELSEKYLRKARCGDWEHETGMAEGYWYGTKDEDGKGKNWPADQYLLINGAWYHFDKDGYCRSGDIVDTETKRSLNQYRWAEDDTGWYYGDGCGNYFTSAWITGSDGTTHYWVGSDGYLEDEYTDEETWQWYNETAKIYRNPHEPDTPYNETDDRYCLPYGYLLYSYTDAIYTLIEKALTFVSKDNESEVYDFFAEAIQAGFKYLEDWDGCEWDWRCKFIYGEEDTQYLNEFRWIQDSTGWYYGDGNGHYFTNAWVEDAVNKHYWVGSDGYYQPQWDDTTPWEWYQDQTGWWYGSKFDDGTTKNFAVKQLIKDTSSNNWCKFNNKGYFVEPDQKKWWYGTKDGADYIFFKYWIIEDHIYWFDSDGYTNSDITYMDKYELRTDGDGTYYGDGAGHYVTNAWVEESASKHYWIGEDGYVDDTKTDTSEWSWHGSWDEGWQYGTSDPATEYDETEATGTNYTSTQQCLIDIDEVCDDQADYTKESLITKIQSLISGKNYTSGSTLDQIMTYLTRASEDSGITKSGMVTYILNLISNSGFDLSGVGDNNETNSATNAASGNKGTSNSDSSDDSGDDSGDDSEDDDDDDSGELINYAKSQMLYITGNNTVYYFNDEGYMVAAYMADNSWEWLSDSKGWWYGDNEGTYPTGQWMKINGKWYFFNTNGYADQSTDDFADSKTGGDDSATFDDNKDGMSKTSYNASEGNATYDKDREGVKAWITDEFVTELKDYLEKQLDELQKSLNDRLEEAAKADLETYKNPVYTAEIDFEQMAGVQGWEEYSYLMENYLGDYVQAMGTSPTGGFGWQVAERINAITYDCLRKRVTKMTIGTPCNLFVKQFLKLNSKGNIVTFQPVDAIETGYSNYDGQFESEITEFLYPGYSSGKLESQADTINHTDEGGQ